MSQENVEVVRRMLTSRRDYEAAFAETRTDLEWVVAKEHPNSRTLHGHEEIRGYFDEWNEMLEDIQFDVDDYREAPNAVVAMGKVMGKGKGGGTPVVVPLMLVCVFEGDKVSRVEEYLDRTDALEAAGLRE
jgi:ketosteroid isomerase-like protein